MRRNTFNYIEEILKDYSNADAYIKEREEELLYPYRQEDLNSGFRGEGGKKDPIGNAALTIAEDKALGIIKRNKRVVQKELDQADSDTRVIIEELYIRKYPQYTMSGLVNNHKISCGRTKAFKLRDTFFENIADELGLMK